MPNVQRIDFDPRIESGDDRTETRGGGAPALAAARAADLRMLATASSG